VVFSDLATLSAVSAAKTDQAQVSARVAFGEGAGSVSTGLSALDYLVTDLGRSARLLVSLEVAPGAVDPAVAASGRKVGEALAPLLRAPGAAGTGFAWLPADEALAGAAIEVSERALLVANADFSGVGGLGKNVVRVFLEELSQGAGLNVHIRVLEGKDPQNVLRAIFKALGAAIGQACRTPEGEAPS
jgi:imidazoleglycerol phosphate dehydratase HisB